MSLFDGGERIRIKLCGMTRMDDVALAAGLGVDAIGLVFAPASRRRLDPAPAAALRRTVPEQVSVVALFMDQPAADVAAIIAAVQPDLLQFHGGEDEGFCAGFGLPYLKAIPMHGSDGDGWTRQTAHHPAAAGFVLDGHAAGMPGGSGQRFDWTLPARTPLRRPWLLAGGLDAGNVAQAVREARPWGVDVASGIESAPGIKDAAMMRAFVAAVRAGSRMPSANDRRNSD